MGFFLYFLVFKDEFDEVVCKMDGMKFWYIFEQNIDFLVKVFYVLIVEIQIFIVINQFEVVLKDIMVFLYVIYFVVVMSMDVEDVNKLFGID